MKSYNVSQGGKVMDVKVIYGQDRWEGLCARK